MYTLASFEYDLPPELIAQRPLERRDASRMLSLDQRSGAVAHLRFTDLPELIASGDALVVNRSRVIPARLTALRDNGREAEVLLVREEGPRLWSAMVHPGGKLKAGRRLSFGDLGSCEIAAVLGGGLRLIRFDADVDAIVERCGRVPLPHYITRDAEAADATRYQTVYADVSGSVAAPTAGLHFSEAILAEIGARGVRIERVTLHVGPGTFKPVTVDDISQHRMHAEYYELSEETAASLSEVRSRGGRIWAVGTTTARVLESRAAAGTITAGSGLTDIFIRPPYRFRAVDAMITNFHLPGSTLIMLVAAFAGVEQTLAAYREAVAERYRFFSYGDAMVIH